MTRKFGRLGFATLIFGSLVFGATVKITGPLKEPSNLVDTPDYDTAVPCSPCEKHQYFGFEPKDAFFSQDRRPAILENGVHYEDGEELYVGGNPSFVPTNDEILEDEVTAKESK